MYEEGHGSFKNEVCKRFYSFYKQKFDQGALTMEGVAVDFEFGRSYKYGFWKLLQAGEIGVNTDQITIAKEKHGLNPAWLWELSDQREVSDMKPQLPPGYIEESKGGYGEETVSYASKQIGEVLDEILTKHKVKRTEYAEQRLQMTPRNLQLILAGKTNPYFATVQTIAEDFGEPLDAFRQRPLPRGHYLKQLRILEARVEEQAATIIEQRKSLDALQRAVFKLSAA